MDDATTKSLSSSPSMMLRNILSTIVTIDFFVVCMFLVWFLSGIVIRSISGNDTIQIAFNNQFESLVQPALGILMLGSAASAIFKPDDDDDEEEK
jgi:hypothetical protein